jgi:uncharacterized repeat protein (TIGR01451 family)
VSLFFSASRPTDAAPRTFVSTASRRAVVMLALLASWALSTSAYAAPTSVVVCKTVDSNNDANPSDGGTFGFSIANQSVALATPSLTATEGQAAQCTAEVPIPAGSTQVTIIETTRPAGWRDGLGYPRTSAAAAGLPTQTGSGSTVTISGPAFSAASGRLTVTYTNANGRRARVCKNVVDNNVAPVISRVWDLQAAGTTLSVTAGEGGGSVCAPTLIDIPVNSTQLPVVENYYEAAAGFPTITYTTTGGQRNGSTALVAGGFNEDWRGAVNSADYTGSTGDFTITFNNRFPDTPPTQRSLQVCARANNDGNSATGPARSIKLSSSIDFSFPSLTMQEGSVAGSPGAEVCNAAHTYWPGVISNASLEIREYDATWRGNAAGFPRWELVNTVTNTVIANGIGDYTTINLSRPEFDAHPSLKVVFTLQEKAAFGTPGGTPVVQLCKFMEDNGNGVAEGGVFGLKYGNNTGFGGGSVSSTSSLDVDDDASTPRPTSLCGQVISSVPVSNASSPMLLNGAPSGLPPAPAFTRELSVVENTPALAQVVNYPIARYYDDVARTLPLGPPVSSDDAGSPYEMRLPVPALARDAYLFVTNRVDTAAPRTAQVCVRIQGNGSTTEATQLGLLAGSNGTGTAAFTAPVSWGSTGTTEVCSPLLPGIGRSGTARIGFSRESQTPAVGTSVYVPNIGQTMPVITASPRLLSAEYSCSVSGNGAAPGVGSDQLFRTSTGFYSSAFPLTEDASCTGNITVRFIYVLARQFNVCKNTIANGDAADDSRVIPLTQSGGSDALQFSPEVTRNVNSVEGGDPVCESTQLRRFENSQLDVFSASESAPSYATGMTPGFPQIHYVSENGLSGFASGTSIAFSNSTTGAPDGDPSTIDGTAGAVRVTFFNRAGPERFVSFCKRIENNNGAPDGQGGAFQLDQRHNSPRPGDPQFGTTAVTVNEVAGQPSTEVCAPTRQLPALADGVRAIETTPAGWVSEPGYPKWELLDGAGTVVQSGTGADTGPVDLSTVDGNPRLVLINRAGTPTIVMTKTLLSGPTPVAGQPSQFDVAYRVTVTNSGASSGAYTLDDAFQFDSDVSVVGTPTVAYSGSETLGTALVAGFNGTSATRVVTDEPLAASGVDAYDISVRVAVAPGSNTANDVCNGTAGNGLFNLATMSPPSSGSGPSATSTANACANTSSVPSLGLSKTNPAAFTVGVAADYTLTVTNSGAGSGATVHDLLPAHIKFNSATGASCAVTGGNVSTGEIVTCTVPGPIAFGGTATITINVTPQPLAAGTTVVNRAAVDRGGGTNPVDPSTCVANDPSTGCAVTPGLLVGGLADIQITKTSSGATYTPGSAVSWTISVVNNGPNAVAQALVSDVVPSTLTNVTWTCVPAAGGACGTSNGTGNISATIALDAGGRVDFTLTATVPTNMTGDLVNTATVETTTGPADPNTTNNSSTSTLTANGGRVIVRKLTQPSGSSQQFAFTTTGSGYPGFQLVDGQSNERGLVSGAYTVTETVVAGWLLADLTCTDPDNGSTVNIATATATLDLDAGETIECVYTNATAANVTAVKSLVSQSGRDDAVAEPGEMLTYSVVLSNSGTTPFTNFNFTETVPAGTRLTQVTGATGCATPVSAGATCELTVATVPGNGSSTVELQFAVDDPLDPAIASIANAISGGDLQCGVAGNVCATTPLPAQATVRAEKALTGESGSVAGQAEPGERLTYSVILTNEDPVAFTDYRFDENVPTGATLVSVTGATAACTMPAPAGTVCAITVSAVPASGTATVTVTFDVDDPLAATVSQITNTISGGDLTCGATGNVCSISTPAHQVVLTLVDDAIDVQQNASTTAAVLGNDAILLNGQPANASDIEFSISTPPTEGTVTFTVGSGLAADAIRVTYTPASNYSGADSFIYTVCDALNPSNCASATVTINVLANVVDAVDDAVSVDQASGANVINVTANDTVTGAALDPASITLEATATHGTVTCAAGDCTYTPEELYFGPDTFSYRICDTSRPTTVCDSAAVTIEVNPSIVELRIAKTAAQRTVRIGDLVRYTLVIDNVGIAPARAVDLSDTMPNGFTFVNNSLSVDDADDQFGVASTHPLRITHIDIPVGGQARVVYLVRVGAGVAKGTHVNRVIAIDRQARTVSNEATAAVVVEGDPVMDESLILGTVFHDANSDGVQQAGERGIPGVRLATVEGLIVETDARGRYHLVGIEPANSHRGSNFIVKLDVNSLPAGAVVTTPNPRVRRITPGLPVRFDFGVALPNGEISGKETHRVSGTVTFDPGSAEVTESNATEVMDLLAKIREADNGRITIAVDGDGTELAFRRAEAVKEVVLQQLGTDAGERIAVDVVTEEHPNETVVSIENGIKVGTILFDTDRATVRPQYRPLIEEIARSLTAKGHGIVGLVGHADARGGDDYNTKLGLKRARAVFEAIAAELAPDVRAKVRLDETEDPDAALGVGDR